MKEMIQHEDEDNDEEPTVPDLPQIINVNYGIPSSRNSGATTPTNALGGIYNGILRHSSRISESVTPVNELTEELGTLGARKVGNKHVRFTALASSDEDIRKSTKQKYITNERLRNQTDPKTGLDIDAIVNEPRRKRLRTILDEDD